MEGCYSEKYGFIGEWYDSQASLIRHFHIFYYPTDNTVEVFEHNHRRPFVRRNKVNGITLDSFYIGATLYIFGRLIKVTDFACDKTRKELSSSIQITFGMTKPMPMNITGKILTHLHQHGLRIVRMKRTRLTADDVQVLYRNMLTDPTYPFLLEHLNNQYIIGMQLVGKDVVEKVKEVLGDRDPARAAPGTVRGLYGVDRVKNCVHVSYSPESALEDIDYFFNSPSRLHLTATLSNCTLCVIKPHAVTEGKIGGILEAISDGGFDITALNMITVENINAGEFYEVYKGIVPEYKGMVEELASGPCVAMELVCKDKSLNSAVEFRKLVGPVDPEIARLLRPRTLRAKFGNTKVQNAVHCSDLPEDGLLEVEYFFKILHL